MVLSDQEIWMEINSGRLSFDPPITPDQVSTSSIDLRLSNQFTTFKPPREGVTTTLDLTKITNIEAIIEDYADEATIEDNQRYTLQPKSFVLAYTREYIKLPNYLAARVEGRALSRESASRSIRPRPPSTQPLKANSGWKSSTTAHLLARSHRA